MAAFIGIDFGERRVGIAVSDPDGTIALPLLVLEGLGQKQLISEIARICGEYEVQELVVGLPINMDGTRGAMAETVEAFAGRLRATLSVPVRTWDERLSTRLVERTLLDADLSRKKRKAVRDKLAAQVILQGYLDARSSK
jgi:putative Holliday junction resolvase